jgi:3-oxoadipate enol-lactonase
LIAVVDSVDLGYDDIGSGMPVVFAHAFPLNRTMWAPQVSALVERCRCIALDMRGFGDSSVMSPYSIEQYADDCAHLLDQLRVDRVVFVGSSIGGYIGFAFWRRHRRRVRAFVLAGARAGPDSDETLTRRRHIIDVAQHEGAVAVANAQIAALIGKTAREKQPDMYDAVHRMIAVAPAEGIVGAQVAMMLRADSTATLATIDVPTLIMVGDEDVPNPVKESRAIHERIPGSRLEIITQAGHLVNLERPAAFNHLLTEFLASLTYS